MVYPAKSEQVALEIAISRNLSYGISRQDGRYYAGTLKELDSIGAVMVCHHPGPREVDTDTIE